MKHYRLLPFLLSLLLFLSACGGDGAGSASLGGASSADASQPEQESPPAVQPVPFTLAVFSDYSLHPVLAANRANLTLSRLLYEPLCQLDAAFQAQPVLCQNWSVSEDKLVWTFTLRAGVTFSDGTPFTGREAADALNLARSAQSRYAQRLADVVSVTGAEQTLTVVLSRPNGDLPALLDIPIALGEGERPAGTGPYILTEREEGLSLTARPGWWQSGNGKKSLPVQTIPLHTVSKSEEMIYAFDAGEISLVDVDLMGTSTMGYGGNYQTWDYATTDFLYLGFNTQNGLCRTPQVRQALALAVDRTAIASEVYANHAVPAALPVHPDSPLYSQSAEVPACDLEALPLRLEELRLTGKSLTLLVNNENTSKAAAAQRIANQLEAVGMSVKVQQLSFEDYTAALGRGDFDLYFGETMLTAGFDLAPLLRGGLNYGGWWAEGADGLLAAMHAATREEKPAAAQALFELLNKEMPIVPIAFKNGSVLTQWGRLSGLNPVRNNVFYQFEDWSIK